MTKRKVSARILSLFLSFVLIVTSVVMVPVSALSSTISTNGTQHAAAHDPSVVENVKYQVNGKEYKYYIFATNNELYGSNDLAKWKKLADTTNFAQGGSAQNLTATTISKGGTGYIWYDTHNSEGVATNYTSPFDDPNSLKVMLDNLEISQKSVTNPYVAYYPEFDNSNVKHYTGDKQQKGNYVIYTSIKSDQKSVIARGVSMTGSVEGPYADFEIVMSTGFDRPKSTDIIQDLMRKSYIDLFGNIDAMPQVAKYWGAGTCNYYSNIIGFNYTWRTEQFPQAFDPSVAKDASGNYWMAYGYRNGGIWMQKVNPATGLIDYTWSCENFANATDEYKYLYEKYNTLDAQKGVLDPYFGQLLVHTAENGDTESYMSSATKSGEAPALYWDSENSKMMLQVSYGSSFNSDGYNVRAYQATNGYDTKNPQDNESLVNGAPENVHIWDYFKDATGDRAVDNISQELIQNVDKRTGLKLTGDYTIRGTEATKFYYSSLGSSSVIETSTKANNNVSVINYQTRFNDLKTLSPVKSHDGNYYETRSHIMVNNIDGWPCITPFEISGEKDFDFYDAAKSSEYNVDDIAGQYEVISHGVETKTDSATIKYLTLTKSGAAIGAVTGKWEVTKSDKYANYITITDEVNNKAYKGVLLKQTVEDSNSLTDNRTETMTFSLVGDNRTILGVKFADLIEGGENNAYDSNLTISPSIYTGGALALNSETNGQLGLKYGNYINSFKFAENDYSTYITINDKYKITNISDYDQKEGDANGLEIFEVTEANIDAIINAVYSNRTLDANEATVEGADTLSVAGNHKDSIDNLKKMLNDKIAETNGSGNRCYILTGYLDSSRYGRNVFKTVNKGDICFVINYKDIETNTDYNEKIYSNVYQQPVSANVSGTNFFYYFAGHQYDGCNAVFMRAEASFSADSYTSDGLTIRNHNARPNSEGVRAKMFSSKALFTHYNPSLYTKEPVFVDDNKAFYHGNEIHFLHNNGLQWEFNEEYRNIAEINTSYERAEGFNVRVNNGWLPVAGPKGLYYIDKSDLKTSNIASYIDENGNFEIPVYYSSISNQVQKYAEAGHDMVFNGEPDAIGGTHWNVGIFDAAKYITTATTNDTVVGEPNYTPESNFKGFTVDFTQINDMYTTTKFNNGELKSYGANILLKANVNELQNTKGNYKDDINFFLRTQSRMDGKIAPPFGNHSILGLVEDMEFGVYVCDKSFTRDYFDSLIKDKISQYYTYFSWEDFRSANRQVESYLNNYIDQIDSFVDTNGDGKYTEDDYKSDKPEFDRWLNSKNLTKEEVLASDELIQQMRTEFPEKVQNIYCYLLTETHNELFSYDLYQEYMDVYNEYFLLKDHLNDFTSSTQQYYGSVNNADIYSKYEGFSNDVDVSLDKIYDPNTGVTEGLNTSWKIINDEKIGTDAKAAFEAKIKELREAIARLRTVADYRALDLGVVKGELSSYFDTKDIKVFDSLENLPAEYPKENLVYTYTNMENQTKYIIYSESAVPRKQIFGSDTATDLTDIIDMQNLFSIDRYTVNKAFEKDNVGKFTQDGTLYTVSTAAAFDKVFNSIYDIKDSNAYTRAEYADKVLGNKVKTSEEDALKVSDIARLDQNKFAENDISNPLMGENKYAYSDVQSLINEKEELINSANRLLTKVDSEQKYETFDYLIDVIETIDINGYTAEGQQMLKDELEKLLVQGGVYCVNQQLFNKTAEENSSLLAKVIYDGSTKYFTGLNAGDVDAATTELLELLNTLDTEVNPDGTPKYKRTVSVDFTVKYDNDTPDKTETIKIPYGTQKEFKVNLGAEQSVYKWVISYKSDDNKNIISTQKLQNVYDAYNYVAKTNAEIVAYITEKPAVKPEYTVYIKDRFGNRTEQVLYFTKEQLETTNISKTDDKTTISIGANNKVVASKVPFYEFKDWKTTEGIVINNGMKLKDCFKGNAKTLHIMPIFAVKGTFNVIANNQNVYNNVQFDTMATITATPSNEYGDFYAWLVKEGQNYKIASYNPEFKFYVASSEEYVQVNKNSATNEYTIFGQTTPIDKEIITPENGASYLDPDSLYYRLQNKLVDSWSSLSEFDADSGKISLYSHFTDVKGIPNSAKVVEYGAILTTDDAVGSDASKFVVDGNGVKKGVSGSNSSSGQSMGQYVISASTKQALNGASKAYMRSYVTYSYVVTSRTVNEAGIAVDANSTVYKTVYSDIESKIIK